MKSILLQIPVSAHQFLQQISSIGPIMRANICKFIPEILPRGMYLDDLRARVYLPENYEM